MRSLVARHACRLLPVALLCCGCAAADRDDRLEPVYDSQSGRLQLLKYDDNGNGRAETVSFMDGSRVLRIEIDKDEDGKVDRWEYYDADRRLVKVGFSQAGDGKADAWSFSGPDGSVARIEMAGRGSERIVRTEYYERDVLVRAEEDSDADGAIDKWDTYDKAGNLASVAFDSRKRGTPDRRIVYSPDGGTTFELDPDGDGRFSPSTSH